MKRRELLAAGIVRDLCFRNPDDSKEYFYRLDHQGAQYKILNSCFMKDGSLIIRIVQQYNSAPLIELYEEAVL